MSFGKGLCPCNNQPSFFAKTIGFTVTTGFWKLKTGIVTNEYAKNIKKT